MGELGNKRNNLLAENGLLFDSNGDVFDLTQWYKDNSASIKSNEINQQILSELKKITAHLSVISGERITEKDTQR
jgi:hypothetical protein